MTKQWTDVTIKDLNLPPSNPFIPRDFHLLTSTTKLTHPIKIDKGTQKCCLNQNN